MNGSRLQRREKRAGQTLLSALRRSVAAVAFGWLAGCGIGLSGAESAFLSPEADAGAAYASADAGAPDGALTLAHDPTADAGIPLPGSGYGVSMSPLCGVTTVTCDPNEQGCVAPPAVAGAGGEQDAGTFQFDAGGSFSDAGWSPDGGSEPDVATQVACRVTAVHSEAGAAGGMPVCGAAGTGQNDAPCSASTDCAGSFECVLDPTRAGADGAASAGVCRSYCCDNVCTAANSYCDIETTVTGSVAVPVCVVRPGYQDAGAACALLDDSSCEGQLTCQVVSADGQVACVAPGTASAGDSCETTKCAQGLSCVLGYFPQRTCAQLCELENNNCPSSQECMPDPSVTTVNPTVGVCENAS